MVSSELLSTIWVSEIIGMLTVWAKVRIDSLSVNRCLATSVSTARNLAVIQLPSAISRIFCVARHCEDT